MRCLNYFMMPPRCCAVERAGTGPSQRPHWFTADPTVSSASGGKLQFAQSLKGAAIGVSRRGWPPVLDPSSLERGH